MPSPLLLPLLVATVSATPCRRLQAACILSVSLQVATSFTGDVTLKTLNVSYCSGTSGSPWSLTVTSSAGGAADFNSSSGLDCADAPLLLTLPDIVVPFGGSATVALSAGEVPFSADDGMALAIYSWTGSGWPRT